MKFSAAIALVAITGANAFVSPKSPAVSTKLAMSDYSVNTSVRDNIDVGVGGPLSRGEGGRDLAEIWDNSSPVIVQGGSLRTWSFANPAIESVQVLLKTGKIYNLYLFYNIIDRMYEIVLIERDFK